LSIRSVISAVSVVYIGGLFVQSFVINVLWDKGEQFVCGLWKVKGHIEIFYNTV